MEQSRHELFVMARLFGSACTVASAPLYVLLVGIPNLSEVTAFGCMILPLLSIVALSRSGNLVLSHIINSVGMIGYAFILAASGHISFDAAAAGTLLLPIEAAMMIGVPAALFTGLSTVAVLGLLHLGDLFRIFTLNPETSLSHFSFAIPILFYIAWLSFAFTRLLGLSKHQMDCQTQDFTALQDLMSDLVLRTDRVGSVLKASEKCLDHFHLEVKDISGRGLFERIHVADRPLYLKTISDAVNLHHGATAVLRLRQGNRTPHETNALPAFSWVELRCRAVQTVDAQGNIQHIEVVAMLRDMSESIRREGEILIARQESEIAAKWKDRFLANVSHELRTPLNAIIGFSDMLSNEQITPKDPAKIREYASIIFASGQHLLEVVNTILDMSKIETGNYHLDSEPFNLASVIEQTCDMVRLKAESGGVTILRTCDERVAQMTADKRAVKQILINLVSNAVKFSPRSSKVEISAQPDGNHVLLSVSDTGIGISAQDMTKLGIPFFQVDGEYNRNHEGTGLGLSVVCGLVGLYNGRISITSALGRGTTITVRLPLEHKNKGAYLQEPAKIDILSHYHSEKTEQYALYAGHMQHRITGLAS